MTRETKVGIVVSCSFLCLLGVVVTSKLHGERPPDSPEPSPKKAVSGDKKGNALALADKPRVSPEPSPGALPAPLVPDKKSAKSGAPAPSPSTVGTTGQPKPLKSTEPKDQEEMAAPHPQPPPEGTENGNGVPPPPGASNVGGTPIIAPKEETNVPPPSSPTAAALAVGQPTTVPGTAWPWSVVVSELLKDGAATAEKDKTEDMRRELTKAVNAVADETAPKVARGFPSSGADVTVEEGKPGNEKPALPALKKQGETAQDVVPPPPGGDTPPAVPSPPPATQVKEGAPGSPSLGLASGAAPTAKDEKAQAPQPGAPPGLPEPKEPLPVEPAAPAIRPVKAEAGAGEQQESPSDKRLAPAAAVITPIVAQVPAGSTPKVEVFSVEEYAVKAGDTFATVSKKKYESEDYAEALRLFNANDSLLSDAGREAALNLQPGQNILIPDLKILERRYSHVIKLPPPRPAAGISNKVDADIRPVADVPAIAGAVPTYEVRQEGITMRQIARVALGNGDRWNEIFTLNRSYSPERALPVGALVKLPAPSQPVPRVP